MWRKCGVPVCWLLGPEEDGQPGGGTQSQHFERQVSKEMRLRDIGRRVGWRMKVVLTITGSPPQENI